MTNIHINPMLLLAALLMPTTLSAQTINGDLNHRRGRILGMESEEGLETIKAEVPMAELHKYATELRSMTQGRGTFDMEFVRYEQVPANVAQEIIAKHQAEKAEE